MGLIATTQKANIQKMRGGRLRVQGWPGVHGEFESPLGYRMRLWQRGAREMWVKCLLYNQEDLHCIRKTRAQEAERGESQDNLPYQQAPSVPKARWGWRDGSAVRSPAVFQEDLRSVPSTKLQLPATPAQEN